MTTGSPEPIFIYFSINLKVKLKTMWAITGSLEPHVSSLNLTSLSLLHIAIHLTWPDFIRKWCARCIFYFHWKYFFRFQQKIWVKLTISLNLLCIRVALKFPLPLLPYNRNHIYRSLLLCFHSDIILMSKEIFMYDQYYFTSLLRCEV